MVLVIVKEKPFVFCEWMNKYIYIYISPPNVYILYELDGRCDCKSCSSSSFN